jgi:glycosyltransferase involved in cell wall biosynthesis
VSVDTGLTLEVLVGDDGSSDGTRDILSKLSLPGVKVIFMPDNVGRGGVIKHLWTLATGDIYVHQDADLEYDPQDFRPLLQPLLAGTADVVYGSRFKGSIEKMRWLNRMGNLTMTSAARMLYGVQLTDLMTCYKMYRASLVRGLRIQANGFDFEAEFTARLAQRRARFAEVPVSFSGRTFEEGKKIRAFDAVRVMRELVRCKVAGESRG